MNDSDWLELVDDNGRRTGRKWYWNPDQDGPDATDSWETALREASAAADELGDGASVYLYENGHYRETEYTAPCTHDGEAVTISGAELRLYRAAPDLLEACEAFLALWPGVHDGSRPAHPDVRMTVNAARAAIAKATAYA